jgi:DNA polymerase elongation subunit (family B)
MVKNKPIIYVIDIETSPAKVQMYGNIYEPVVVKILEFEQILSIAIRKFGENKSRYIGQNTIKGYKPGVNNDKNLLIKITEELKDADFIVGHNLDDFDVKKIKERIMFHRLPPFPEIPSLDTKKLIKSSSKLPSNKLDHVTQFLGNGGKISHNGVGLFTACADGDKKAWKVNEEYNKRDVDITYKDLEDIMPYVKLPNTYSRINADINCSNVLCLSTHLTKSKLRRVTNGWKQQYQCTDCGKYTTDSKTIKDEKK